MQKTLIRFARLIFGLFLYALGIVLTIKANIGYGPWEVFHAGLGRTIGISIGNASILVGFIIILITLLLGEKPGIGTILNMLLIGIFMDFILKSDLVPLVENKYFGLAVLIVGLYIISLASYFYIGSGFGAGPRDGLMIVLTRKTKLPIGIVRGTIELTATVIGWMLGGMAGIGTVISGLAIGFCIQSTFRLLKFKPEEIANPTMKKLDASRIGEFSDFVRKVFDEFVSADYCVEGNQTFYDFIAAEEVRKRFDHGNLFLIEESDGRIIGALELRDSNHISLLFVDKAFQRKGIGKKLFGAALTQVREKDPKVAFIEVNSSPFAKEIYEKMGFAAKSGLKEKNGIKYYELVYEIRK